MQPAPTLPAKSIERLEALLKDGKRKLVGLAGPPGAGKSTLAFAIQGNFPNHSQVVPMDGFHLAQTELERLGRADRKGAPDTFDSAGYVALLRRLRSGNPHDTVYAPSFSREREEAVAGSIAVENHVQLVITEGNYLLLDSGPWADVSALLDDVWYVDVDEGLRTERLTRRHQQFGRSRQDASHWVSTIDEPNAALVTLGRSRELYFPMG